MWTYVFLARHCWSFLFSLVHIEASATSILFPILSLLFFRLGNLRSLVRGFLKGVLRPLVLLGFLLRQLLLFQFLLLLFGGLLVSQSLEFCIFFRFLLSGLFLFEGFVFVRLFDDDGAWTLQDLRVADQDVEEELLTSGVGLRHDLNLNFAVVALVYLIRRVEKKFVEGAHLVDAETGSFVGELLQTLVVEFAFMLILNRSFRVVQNDCDRNGFA